ncbi:DUF1127 domain-containing protein [Vibrio sp. WJH972]
MRTLNLNRNSVLFAERQSQLNLSNLMTIEGGKTGGRVQLWFERAKQRRTLKQLALNPQFLEDIGVSYQEAIIESRKPFWRK